MALTRDGLRKGIPAFSADGSKIAYTVLGPNNSWDSWIVPVLGGDPKPWLPNASGIRWIGRSILSPDRHWVLITEMDNGGMIPCRVVPFDGSSRGHRVGPEKGQCTHAAWSPDGKEMYFTSNAGGGFQIWRQTFPDGTPEPITSGPTEAEGPAISPDGKSIYTSIGFSQSSAWINEQGTERQLSGEGDAWRGAACAAAEWRAGPSSAASNSRRADDSTCQRLSRSGRFHLCVRKEFSQA